MGNQPNSKFVEENGRKNFCFLEKWSSVLPRRLSENISHQLLSNYIQLFNVSVWSITPGFNAIIQVCNEQEHYCNNIIAFKGRN